MSSEARQEARNIMLHKCALQGFLRFNLVGNQIQFLMYRVSVLMPVEALIYRHCDCNYQMIERGSVGPPRERGPKG